jgi:AraC family transcriptional regulator of adaptative response / DNA-3-methyladenine glycosylase II
VRRFNETFLGLFRRPPTALRREVSEAASRGGEAVAAVTVHLRYRPPFDWESLLAFLEARAIVGVERVARGTYSRTIVVDGKPGSVHIAHVPKTRALAVTLRVPSVRSVSWMVTRLRRLFDLTADTSTIESHLSRDPVLRRLVEKRPGLRVPGGWDGYELAVRAVLGQQVTVVAARASLGRLCELHGTQVSVGVTGDPELRLTFPEPRVVARADLRGLGVPESRKRTLVALSEAARRDPNLFEAGATVEETVARLEALPGVGPWTAAMIALRACREPDAFPAGDAGLLRSSMGAGSSPRARVTLDRRAELWRPWRGYAAEHLWAEDAASRRRERTR